MGKRRVTLFMEFGGEPDDDSKLALHVAEALVNRLKGVGEMECKSFTPGPAILNSVSVCVGVTKFSVVEYELGKGFVIDQLSEDKHG